MLVHRSRYEEAVDARRQGRRRVPLGDPFDGGTRLGPLVSAAQRERYAGTSPPASPRGHGSCAGGLDAPVPDRGHFVAPTVLADVDPERHSRPGGDLRAGAVVIPFDSDDEAVAIANNSRYGLAGGVWSATRTGRSRSPAGCAPGAVDINGGAFNPLAPFGGYKQSGVGRELGAARAAEFTQVKAIQQ